MLPELFQDDEKAISPTSATSSGRTPLTRTPSKPTKGRPGQMAKEHKKTVGHQVSSGSFCFTASILAQLELGSKGEERLELSLCEHETLSIHTSPPNCRPVTLLKPFQEKFSLHFHCSSVFFPQRPLLPFFVLWLFPLWICTAPSPFFDVLCSVGSGKPVTCAPCLSRGCELWAGGCLLASLSSYAWDLVPSADRRWDLTWVHKP